MNKTFLLDAFDYYHVSTRTSTKLAAVTDEGTIVEHEDGSRETLPADTVVLSLGYRPVKGLAEALNDCPAQVLEIGDGSQVGNVLTCIRDAYDAVASL